MRLSSGFTLRDYQERDIQRLREALRTQDRILYQLPTGGGKTVVMSTMADSASAKGNRTMFVVHRQELLLQASRTFDRMGIAHGLIAPKHTMTRDLVQIASVATLVRRFDQVIRPDFIVFDEAHHCAAGQWLKVFNAYQGVKMIGLSATPTRLDGAGLDHLFENMVSGPSVSDLMKQGYLSNYRLYKPPFAIDVSGVKNRAGDFARNELEKAVDKPTITGDAVKHYLQKARGKKAICFCVSIAHSQHVVAQFNANGVRAVHIDGTEDSRRRARIMKDFADGHIDILSNVDLISEGFDVPDAEVAILMRPTQSLSLYLQQVGRVLRAAPNKTHAIILDHAANVYRHGLPDDDREWSLKGKPKQRGGKNAEPTIALKSCPECYATHAPSPTCPACGHVYEITGREVESVEGDLEEVDKEQFRKQRRREVGRARTLEDLKELAESRGYKPGWAEHVWRSRQKRRGGYAGAY